jgi:cytoskeletal protein RodZ
VTSPETEFWLGQFGEKFRKEREQRGLTLDDVSNVTKISSRMLQAIEQEHFDQLPGGVFNKGFIRAYAKHLGLNDQEAVTEYLDCLRQAQIAAQASWQPPVRKEESGRRSFPAAGGEKSSTAVSPSVQTEELPELQLPRAEHVRKPPKLYAGQPGSLLPRGIIAASALVIVLLVLLWHRHPRSSQPEASSSLPSASAAQPVTGANPASGGQSAMQSSSQKASGPSPQPVNPKQASLNAASQATPTAQNAATTPASAVEKTPAAASADSDVTKVIPAKPKADLPLPLNLVIRASENSWVSISADGQTVSRETLIAPANTSVRANREVVVRVGNAAGVSFLFNGKEIPPQGNESEVKILVFDSSGLKSSTSPNTGTTN